MKKENKKTTLAVELDDDQKAEALQTVFAQLEKQFGKGTIMRMGDKTKADVEVIPTGSLCLDLAVGIGGVPRGRVVELYGPESSGKTTLSLHIIAEAQKQGGEVAFIDAEHALDPVYAQALGVNVDKLIVSQPDTGEDALQIAETLARSGAIDIIVIDSVAALVPKTEIEGEMGDAHVGAQARLMSQALRKLTGVANKTNTTILFINQLRLKIGVMYGNPETTTGGQALKFYSSIRLEIRKQETIKSGSEILGNHTRVKVVKNKMAPPFKECYFDIMYGKGISHSGEVLDLATEYDIVKKGGAWYSYNDEKIGQGRDNAKLFLEEHPEILNEIEYKIRVKLELPIPEYLKDIEVFTEEDDKPVNIKVIKPKKDIEDEVDLEDKFGEDLDD
ncbi:MAG: recombinase RecA [Clostridia bacterium]|nr:recombinase RecA [Clostridia bacterium]